MPYTFQSLIGPELNSFITDIAQLRITVFREYPYLYDGSLAYEMLYLKAYAQCPESLAIVVFHKDRVVGVSTGLPMEYAEPPFREPFEKNGIDPGGIFYFGESVLLKEHRGSGIYPRFFDGREMYADSLNRFSTTAFCAVERPPDHPMKPEGYTPLDRYWEKRGYTRRPDLVTSFPWKDLHDEQESMKPMIFWTRDLDALSKSQTDG